MQTTDRGQPLDVNALRTLVTTLLLASGMPLRAQGTQPTFLLRFEVPDVVAASRDGARRVEATVLIETRGLEPGEPGAEGWSIFISATGCDVVGVSTLETAAAGADFEKSEYTACRCPEGYTGALASALLSFTGEATLPVEPSQSILRMTLEGSAAEDGTCSECVLDVVEVDNCNMCHTGEPVATSVTYEGEVHSPEVVPRTLRFCAPKFHRGEVNGDGRYDLADAVAIFAYLFSAGPTPGCLDAADGDDDGDVNIADGVFLLGHLFFGGPPPAAPGPPPAPCGADPDPPGGSLGCASPPEC